jgi:hypothetical protein
MPRERQLRLTTSKRFPVTEGFAIVIIVQTDEREENFSAKLNGKCPNCVWTSVFDGFRQNHKGHVFKSPNNNDVRYSLEA